MTARHLLRVSASPRNCVASALRLPSGKKATPYQRQKARKRFRKRVGIKPIIGHLKSDYRLIRNYLKGTVGDSINLMLAAAAFNCKKWMREIHLFFTVLFINDILKINNLRRKAKLELAFSQGWLRSIPSEYPARWYVPWFWSCQHEWYQDTRSALSCGSQETLVQWLFPRNQGHVSTQHLSPSQLSFIKLIFFCLLDCGCLWQGGVQMLLESVRSP